MNECSVAADKPETVSPISLKGTSHGFEILIQSTASAERIACDIEGKLDEAPGFFQGGDVILRFDDAPPRGYLGPIEAVTDRYGLRIVAVHGPDAKSAEEASMAELMSELGLVEPVLAAGSEPVSPDVAELAVASNNAPEGDFSDPTDLIPDAPADVVAALREDGVLAPKMIVGPVRSGCTLEFDGHLIVLGDINPGAEVSAVGSIVVLGRLRGIAHAGCTGASAFILALQLQPQQLRIGALVARAGDSDEAPEKAEIAYAKDGSIMVDYYKGRVPAGIATAKF
jgi:septum site-determining protein MinC